MAPENHNWVIHLQWIFKSNDKIISWQNEFILINYERLKLHLSLLWCFLFFKVWLLQELTTFIFITIWNCSGYPNPEVFLWLCFYAFGFLLDILDCFDNQPDCNVYPLKSDFSDCKRHADCETSLSWLPMHEVINVYPRSEAFNLAFWSALHFYYFGYLQVWFYVCISTFTGFGKGLGPYKKYIKKIFTIRESINRRKYY